MYQFAVSVAIAPPKAKGPKAAEAMRMFGIGRTQLAAQKKTLQVEATVGAGEVLFITGASGAGKSTLLRGMYEQASADARLRLEDIAIEDEASAIDCLGDDDTCLHSRLEALNRAGLSDVFCMLRPPAQLSTGEQARYRLARALASGRRLIFADEFTASMDRITVLAVAHHLRKTATRSGVSFVIASCHEDIIEELRPDIVIRL